jgi:hypothetical protein
MCFFAGGRSPEAILANCELPIWECGMRGKTVGAGHAPPREGAASSIATHPQSEMHNPHSEGLLHLRLAMM